MFSRFLNKGPDPYTSLRIFILLTITCLVNQGCSTTGGPVIVEDRSVPAGEETPGDHQNGSAQSDSPEAPAVVALLDTAQQDMVEGRSERAAATLERALRLEPKNSLLWHRLALIRQQQKLWQQASSLAQKSNSLAAGNRELQLANWLIIARASEHLNNEEGVQRAKEMIKRIRSEE